MDELELKSMPLVDLFNVPADIEKNTSSIWLRAYAVRGIPRKLVHRLNDLYPGDLRLAGRSIWTRFITLEKSIELQDLCLDLITSEEGGLQIVIRSTSPKTIPASSYCFVSTIFNRNGISGIEHETKSALDAAIGLLRLHFGWAAFNHILADQELNLSNNSLQNRTGAIRIPQRNEGPFLHPINWFDSEEILKSIDSHEEPQRLVRALEYIHKGFSESD